MNRLPILLQTEVTECGHACLAMILHYHHYPVDLSALRRIFPTSLRGITLKSLIKMAEHFDLKTTVLKLEMSQLDSLRLPVILHWNMNHFVVLKKIKGQKFILHDPAEGEKTLSRKAVSQHFTGIALEIRCLSPPKKIAMAQTKLPLTALIKNVTGIKKILFKILFFAFCLQLLILIGPKYLQLVVDKVILAKTVSLLYLLAAGFLGLKVLEILVGFVRALLIAHLGNQMNLQIGAQTFQHLIRLPLSFFEKRYLGDIISRFNSVEQIRQIFSQGLVEGCIDGLMAILTLIMMLRYSATLTAVVLVAVMIYTLIRFKLFHRFKKNNEMMLRHQAIQNSIFMENIRGIQPIKIFGKEMYRQISWKNKYIEFLNSALTVSKLKILFTSSKDFLFGIELILVILLGAQAVLNHQISIGMLYAFIFYQKLFTDSTDKLLEKGLSYKMLSLYLDRLADILLKTPEKLHQPASQKPLIRQNRLVLQNVWFRYATSDPFVIQAAQADIRDGEYVAITGPSGCGKTTLLKLMMGLLSPTRGKICLDGINLQALSISAYRQHIASVMQDDCLLSGSIAENISFFDPTPNLKKIYHVAEISGIAADIEAMPMRYATLVGDMGSTLSGGQKQRILIARALYAEPKILFLDEATSHLDAQKESEISVCIQQLGMTRIIIAHRQETIRMADRVLRLEELMDSKISLPSP